MSLVKIELTNELTVEVIQPYGFRVSDKGIYALSTNKNGDEIDIYISELIWNEAIIRYKHTDDIHYLIRGIHVVTGELFERVVSRADLVAENQNSLRRELANAGAGIAYGKSAYVFAYLYSQNARQVIQGLTTTGWHTLDDGSQIYIGPNKIYGSVENSLVRYSPRQVHQSHKNIFSNCSVEEQKQHVGDLCKGNPMLLFALGHALAALMAAPLNRDCLNVHIFGLTSLGKTIFVQVSASIIGNAVAPNTDPYNTCIQTWNTTSNGLELLATAFDDMPLPIDELGANSGNDLGADLYKLFNGAAKSRMNPDGTSWFQETWRVSIISTGELSVEQMIKGASGKNTIKGGQLIRVNDIPAKDILVDTKDMNPSEYGELLKHNCSKYFGAYGDRMLEYLTEIVNSQSALDELNRECSIAESSLINDGLSVPERRSIKRMGLVKLALLKAVELGMLDITESEAHEAVATVRDLWLENTTVISDIDRAVERLRDFIRQNQQRFRSAKNDAESDIHCRDIVGYWSIQSVSPFNRMYHFIPNELKAFCDVLRINHRELLKELVSIGALHQNNTDRGKYRYTSKHEISGAGKSAYYTIKDEFLDEYSDDEVQTLHKVDSPNGGAFKF